MFHTLVKGKLYVVATPIGNLDDISIRAKMTLQAVDWIACEDTRHSSRLLNYLGIKKTLYALHEFNEQNQAIQLIEKLKNGESGALISDAGTPLISDPGFELIKLAHENEIPVTPIPGACALISALSALAIGGNTFHFEGFLPSKSAARLQRLTELKGCSESLVFYEAPHRIKATLHALHEVFGPNRLAGIARELTKKFESLYRDTIGVLLTQAIPERGEFVVVVAGAPKLEVKEEEHAQFEAVLKILLAELPLKQAVKLTCEITGAKKNSVYEFGLELMNREPPFK